jgi:hypothetical protein
MGTRYLAIQYGALMPEPEHGDLDVLSVGNRLDSEKTSNEEEHR